MNEFDELMNTADAEIMTLLGSSVVLPSGSNIQGIFEIPFDEGRLKSLRLDYSRPVVTVFTSDSPLIAENDVLVIKGQRYTAAKKLPDDDGMTVIYLAQEQETDASNWL